MSSTEPPPYPSGDDPDQPAATPPPYPPPPPSQPGMPPQPGVPPQYGAALPAAVPGSSKATTSLVTGIIGLLCCGIVLGPIAIITGKQATTEAAAAGFPQPGNAKAGIILGWISIALFILGILAWILIVVAMGASTTVPSDY